MVEKLKKIKKRAKELGAEESWIIDADKIIIENRTTLKCNFGCDGYGSRVCPPFVPTPEEFREILNEYENCLLVKWASDNKMGPKISENFIKYE